MVPASNGGIWRESSGPLSLEGRASLAVNQPSASSHSGPTQGGKMRHPQLTIAMGSPS